MVRSSWFGQVNNPQKKENLCFGGFESWNSWSSGADGDHPTTGGSHFPKFWKIQKKKFIKIIGQRSKNHQKPVILE